MPLGWQGNFQYVAKGLFSFSRFTILTFGGVVALGCCFCPKNCSDGPGKGGAPLASGTSGVGGGGGGFGLFSSFAFTIAVSMSFSRVANRSCSCSVGVFDVLVFLLLVSFLNVKLSLAICSSRFCKKEAREQ